MKVRYQIAICSRSFGLKPIFKTEVMTYTGPVDDNANLEQMCKALHGAAGPYFAKLEVTGVEGVVGEITDNGKVLELIADLIKVMRRYDIICTKDLTATEFA